MKALVQRVTEASVEISGEVVANIGPGLLVLLGVARGDTKAEADQLAEKTVNLRIFDDENGRMNRSVADVGGEVLVVSQFTLAADMRKGNRPNFTKAAEPELAKELYELYAANIEMLVGHVATGRFGSKMSVQLVNDGPVTLLLER